MPNYLDIESASSEVAHKIRQDLKFRTGNFVWKVKFNTPLDPRTVNNTTMFVTDMNQKPLRIAVRYDSLTNSIEIEPVEPYAQKESYILTVTTKVASKGGQYLKDPIRLQFKID